MLQLQGQGWVHHLKRRSRWFSDPSLTAQAQFEDLKATRVGGLALATHPIGKDARWAVSASADHDIARVENLGGEVVKGDVTLFELAATAQYEKKTVRGRTRTPDAAHCPASASTRSTNRPIRSGVCRVML